MPRYLDLLNTPPYHSTAELTPDLCRKAATRLEREVQLRVYGQDVMLRRAMEAVILSKHCLVVGVPGEAKTTCVNEIARRSGLRFRRIQFRSDMLASDLTGMRLLDLNAAGVPVMSFREGPLYAALVVADEFNRGPSRVQASMLETMAERQITRLDQDEPDLPYHPLDLQELSRLLTADPNASCYGISLPGLKQKSRVFQCMFATQNPVEQEGTYPPSEASIDRFMFLVEVDHPGLNHYQNIVRVNLDPPDDEEEIQNVDRIPFWLKTISLFEFGRQYLLRGPNSQLQVLWSKRGLWDRLRLMIQLSRYSMAGTEFSLAADEGVASWIWGKEIQERLREDLSNWYQLPSFEPVRRTVQNLLTSPLWKYVERGISPRGLLDWTQAALVEAFLKDELPVRRRHLRDTANHVLQHRISLTPQARADQIESKQLVQLIVQALLPELPNNQEAIVDQIPLLPDDDPPPPNIDE